MSELATDFHRLMREEARLTILKSLGEQVNESLNSSILQQVLATFAINMERPWVHQQIDYLETMGAVTVVSAGSVKIATLTEVGRRHLDRQSIIEGVKRPSRPGA